MSNYEIAKMYGIKMVSLTKQGGTIGLGLIGSGLDVVQTNQLFNEINQAIPVKLIKVEVGSNLMMEKL